jgi:probable transposase
MCSIECGGADQVSLPHGTGPGCAGDAGARWDVAGWCSTERSGAGGGRRRGDHRPAGECRDVGWRRARHPEPGLRTLRRREREKARRAEGGKNRAETRREVAVGHGKVARARRDYHRKQALGLVRENHAVHVEDLPHRGYGHTPPVGPVIHDAGWGSWGCCTRRPNGRAGTCTPWIDGCPPPRRARPAGRSWTPCRSKIRARVCPGMRHQSRSRPQRGTKHPRRRACGEAKRLWSRCQSFLRGERVNATWRSAAAESHRRCRARPASRSARRRPHGSSCCGEPARTGR